MKNTTATTAATTPNYVTIANAIELNCDALVAGRIDQATWKANQNALWAEAARQHVASDVMRLICPSLLEKKGRKS